MQWTYDSLNHIFSLHWTSLSRGKSKTIFADPSIKVMHKCLGVRVGRASTGVLDYDVWAKRFGAVHWRWVLTRMTKRVELLFKSFAGDKILHYITVAQRTVPYKTMHAPPDPSSPHIPSAKYFGGIAFGCNVFLCCHTDDDFTLSMAHILLDGKDVYSLEDEVVVYSVSQHWALLFPCDPEIFFCSTPDYHIASPPDVGMLRKLCAYWCF